PRKEGGGAGLLQNVHGKGKFEAQIAQQGADLPQDQEAEIAVEKFFFHGHSLRNKRMRTRAAARTAAPRPAHQRAAARRPASAKRLAAACSPAPASSSRVRCTQRNRAQSSQKAVRPWSRRLAPASSARSRHPAAYSTFWSNVRSVMVDTSVD